MKKFTIFTEPSLADPAWLCPVADITQQPPTMYTEPRVVLDIIWKQQYDIGFEAGRQSGVRQEWKRVRAYLESLGWPEDQIHAALMHRPTE